MFVVTYHTWLLASVVLMIKKFSWMISQLLNAAVALGFLRFKRMAIIEGVVASPRTMMERLSMALSHVVWPGLVDFQEFQCSGRERSCSYTIVDKSCIYLFLLFLPCAKFQTQLFNRWVKLLQAAFTALCADAQAKTRKVGKDSRWNVFGRKTWTWTVWSSWSRIF